MLHVSAGQAVSVPVACGPHLSMQAQAKLGERRTLSRRSLEQASDTAAGIVISQDPASGTVVAKGSTVRLVVSSGPATPPST